MLLYYSIQEKGSGINKHCLRKGKKWVTIKKNMNMLREDMVK